jgi:hypothetical protein
LVFIEYIFNYNPIAGKPWTYKLEIQSASNLPVFCEMAYVSYDFFGESFTTEAVEQTTFSPVFDYKKIHHIPSVTPEFIKYLKGAVEMQIHVTQHIEPPMVRTVLYFFPTTLIYSLFAADTIPPAPVLYYCNLGLSLSVVVIFVCVSAFISSHFKFF